MRAAALLLAMTVVAAPRVQAQAASHRFEVVSVTDTSFTFRAGVPWIRRGVVGVAVDPRRRDALVARFRVIDVQAGVATALITGQTTDVSADHVATLTAPATPWYRRGSFWAGLFLGGAIGAVAGAS